MATDKDAAMDQMVDRANDEAARAWRELRLANQRLESMTALSQDQARRVGLLEEQVVALSALVSEKSALNLKLMEQVAALSDPRTMAQSLRQIEAGRIRTVQQWDAELNKTDVVSKGGEQLVWQQDEELLEATRKQLAAGWEPPLAEAARNCLAPLSAAARRESILQGYDGVPCPGCGELKTVSSTEDNRWVCEGCTAEGKMVPTERPASDNMTRTEVKAELELMGIDVGAAVDRVLTAVTAAEVRSAAHHPNKAEGLINLERE